MFNWINALRRATGGEKGFTLIELLVTVSIIGILAAVVTAGLTSIPGSTVATTNKAQLNAVQNATDNYLSSDITRLISDANLSGAACGASCTGTWYTSDGVTAYTPAATDVQINTAYLVANSYLRLNASSPTFGCLFAGTTSVVKACRN